MKNDDRINTKSIQKFEQQDVHRNSDIRHAYQGAAKKGQEYFRGYVDGWEKAFEIFLKEFRAHGKLINNNRLEKN